MCCVVAALVAFRDLPWLFGGLSGLDVARNSNDQLVLLIAEIASFVLSSSCLLLVLVSHQTSTVWIKRQMITVVQLASGSATICIVGALLRRLAGLSPGAGLFGHAFTAIDPEITIAHLAHHFVWIL